MGASKARRTATAERRAKAIGLRLAGRDWESIAAALGYASRGAACTDVTRALASNLADVAAGAADLRALEAARLDTLQEAIWPEGLAGNLQAAHMILRLMERRARLLGLDAPVRAAVDVAGQVGVDELLRLIDHTPSDDPDDDADDQDEHDADPYGDPFADDEPDEDPGDAHPGG